MAAELRKRLPMTPLHLEMLLHYYCSGDEFERLDAPACREVLHEFLREGLLEERDHNNPRNNTHMRAYDPTPRADALIEHLCATPYPKQMWVRGDAF